jgi:hypothetical protein
MNRAGVEIPLPQTQRATSEALRQACQDLQCSIRQHANVCQSELMARIDSAVQMGNKSKAKALRAITTAENNLQTFKILKAMKHRGNVASSIDRIEIPMSWPPAYESITSITQLEDPKTCTEWRLVTDPKEVEYYIGDLEKWLFAGHG